MNSKRIIIVGRSASGKNFLRNKFIKRGFTYAPSYTSRQKRDGETNQDYIFISEYEFKQKIKNNEFFEHNLYNGNYYATGLNEFLYHDLFIMEPNGISNLNEYRNSSLIIYLNTDVDIRINRMEERGWTKDKITERLKFDDVTFWDFKDYDVEVTNVF